MKNSVFKKIFFSFVTFAFLFAGCEDSDYFTVSEYEQYLVNLKNGVLDTPALTVQHLPQKIYYSSSSVKDGLYQYDYEIVTVSPENQREIKDLDVYIVVFNANIQTLKGKDVDAEIKELKIVTEEKEIPLTLSESTTMEDGKLNFAQELLLKDFAVGLKDFTVVLSLQTKKPEQIIIVPSDPSVEHFKSENIALEYVECPKPDEVEKEVTLTFKNADGTVFQTLIGKPLQPIDAPTPELFAHDFVAWEGLPALCPQKDAKYEPIFKLTDYVITYMLDGGVNSRGNPDYYTIETPKFVLHPATREGYIFEGWYKERVFRTRVTRVEQGTAEDMVLYAKFSLPVEGGGQITLNKNEMVLYSGQNEQLVADIVLLLDGSSPPVMWTSNNEDVVVVDSEGNVTALNVEKETTAVVTASYSDLNASCKITVIPVE